MRIFVQIASYRDRELIPTIRDLIAKAKKPENLRIGICRQYHPEDGFDNLDSYKKDKRFRIVDVLYKDSKGTCWARNISQQVYMGEEYTMQIDSHMRFAKHWDEIMISMIRFLQAHGFSKPMLTGYMGGYDPNKPLNLNPNEPPLHMVFDKFTKEGVVLFKSEVIPDWKKKRHPLPARFCSGGFYFTLGIFCKEVQYDPEFYFIGEEISISVRAFTHGYDLFHPHKNLLWHYYTRKKNVRQWDDDKTWTKRDAISVRKNRILFGMEKKPLSLDLSRYGFGTARTLRDYERYSGILFAKRAVQKYTIEGKFPPNPGVFNNEQQWMSSFMNSRIYSIKVPSSLFKETDYDFWVVAFHNEKGETIFRKDADKNEIESIISSHNKVYEIRREIYALHKPHYWVLLPHTISKGWCKRLTGYL